MTKLPPTLETERLKLQPFTLADSNFIMELLNTEGFLKYIGDRNIKNTEDAEQYLQNGPLKSYAEHGFGLCKVLLKSSNDEALWLPIGICGLLKRDYLDHPDIGYALLPEFEGKGYAKESAEAVLRWGFEERDFNVISAIVLPNNDVSIRLLERLGMKLQFTITDPQTNDELLVYSISVNR
jgi:RimJ/RimL family protein N-acetyltransferase